MKEDHDRLEPLAEENMKAVRKAREGLGPCQNRHRDVHHLVYWRLGDKTPVACAPSHEEAQLIKPGVVTLLVTRNRHVEYDDFRNAGVTIVRCPICG